MKIMLCRKLFAIPFQFRNLYSTLVTTHAYSQSLFSHFASTKFNISAADITLMFKSYPHLQRLQTLDKVEQFVDMLNRHGCSEVQIAMIMRKEPSLITTNAERILEPKIKLLEDYGFQGITLAKLLTSNPQILGQRLENNLIPKMEFLKSVFQSQDSLIRSLLKVPFIFGYSLEKVLKPSLAYWEGWGFHGTELSSFIRIEPAILQRSSLTPAQVDLIQKIGVDKGSKSFKYIVRAVAVGRRETLEAKIENLKLCGLSAEETRQVCSAVPQVLGYSKKRVRETMNFVVNNLELPVNFVVKHYHLFHLNLEKTMWPRFLVWQKIKSTNDLGLSIYTVLTMREATFARKVIGRRPESTTLRTIYENAVCSASNHTKSSSQC